jgi:hypothetical protein
MPACLRNFQARTAGENEITADLIEKHVTFLASDENQGRDTGAGKLEGPVTEYVEKHWKQLGVKPAGNAEGSTYRQPFTVQAWDGLGMKEADHRHIFGTEANAHGFAYAPGSRPPLDKLMQVLASHHGPLKERKTHNLVGIVEGSDPALKNEYIVIGAHLDHIGVGSPDKNGDQIYNGADDNGSGSSAVLAITQALVKAKADGHGPGRSVIVILFSGEELGLLGSQFFVEHPTVEIGKIKAMINLDMVGRLDPKQVSIFDRSKNGEPNLFHSMHDTSGTRIERIDHNVNSLVRRSDQASFYDRGIPVMFFFEGFTPEGEMNPDYHGAGDHADKIDGEKVADIARMAYRHLMAASRARIE